MSMLKTVLSNLCRPARTRLPADMPILPPAFRGLLSHDASLCTGCNTCAHVCAPKAIQLEDKENVSVSWSFFAGQCSFCGLCAQYCPTKAIKFSEGVFPVTGDASAHRQTSVIDYRPCTRCGKPHIPMPDKTSAALPGGTVIETGLCPECRRKAASERIREGFAFLGASCKESGHD